MRIIDICKNYFNCFEDLSNDLNNYKVRTLTVLKILSYFTVVLPLCFATIYGAISLYDRVSKKQELSACDRSVNQVKENIFTLTPKTEKWNDLGRLPISNETLQRTYLVRHGESEANVYSEVNGKRMRLVSGQSSHIPLTRSGVQQVEALAENLAQRFPSNANLVIVSSNATRTIDSARLLFDKLQKTHPTTILASEVYEGLNERSLGAWEGMLKDEQYTQAEKPWKAMSAAHKFVSPEVVGGESCSEVASRALFAIGDIYNRYSDKTIIAVTSCNTINAIAIQLNDLPRHLSEQAGTELPKLKLENGDVMLIETEKDVVLIRRNIVSHITNNALSH